MAKTNVCVNLNMQDPLAEQAVQNRLTKVTQINETMRAKLRQRIEEGIKNGESTGQVAQGLRQEFKFADYRARMIARTEANASASDARDIQFTKMFGPSYKKEWISSRDPFVRESHQQVDSEIVKSTERFSNGLSRPHDPSGPPEEVINCRCTYIAIPGEDEPKYKKATMADFQALRGKGKLFNDLVVDQRFVDIWNANVKMNPEEFFGTLMKDVSRDGNLFLRGRGAKKAGEEGGRFTIEYVKSGEMRFERIWDFNNRTVNHAYFSIEEKLRSKGTSKNLLRNSMQLYQQTGVIEKVTLHANIDVGGYAWAKYGFSPELDGWSYLRKNILNRAMTIKDLELRKLAFDFLEKSATNLHAVWALSDMKVGKELLLGLSWEGSLKLNDKLAMERFNAYAGK